MVFQHIPGTAIERLVHSMVISGARLVRSLGVSAAPWLRGRPVGAPLVARTLSLRAGGANDGSDKVPFLKEDGTFEHEALIDHASALRDSVQGKSDNGVGKMIVLDDYDYINHWKEVLALPPGAREQWRTHLNDQDGGSSEVKLDVGWLWNWCSATRAFQPLVPMSTVLHLRNAHDTRDLSPLGEMARRLLTVLPDKSELELMNLLTAMRSQAPQDFDELRHLLGVAAPGDDGYDRFQG